MAAVRRAEAHYRWRGHLWHARAAGPHLAPERWHEPRGDGKIRYVVEPAGKHYVHAVTVDEIRDRLAALPQQFVEPLEVVQLSRMTRKRDAFPCYGMQWGATIYLYPVEEDLIEVHHHPPRPEQQIEARMYGGRWYPAHGGAGTPVWHLRWTWQAIKDYYLNNVLIHELGHLIDVRNSRTQDRERFANWFAIEYGYRRARKSRVGA